LNTFGKLLVKLGATPPPDSEFWYGPVAPLSGSYLSQFAGDSGALRINAVNACVRLRSETIGSLPCQVYRREADGRTVDRQHPLYRILHDAPNDSMSAFEFWQIAEQNLCTDGNFYAQILTDARNNVAELIPIDPEKMNVQRDDETGIIVFVETTGAAPKTYAEGDILHIPGMGYDGRKRLKGMSPVAYMRQSLELSADAESYGARYFRNNAAPPAYIAHPNTLSDKAKEGILEYFMKHFGGVRNAGKLGILEEGMQLKTVPINHTDMQYLELRKFQVEEIARMYRVPLHMIGELSRSTNNTSSTRAWNGQPTPSGLSVPVSNGASTCSYSGRASPPCSLPSLIWMHSCAVIQQAARLTIPHCATSAPSTPTRFAGAKT